MDELNKIYFDPSHVGSFGGPDRLSKAAKIAPKKAKLFLQKVETYTKHKAVRHKFRMRKISSPIIDYIWQTDLITVSKYAKVNKGYKYLITVIDVASRFSFVHPIKTKSGKSVTEGFQEILKSSGGRKPKFLQSDEGKEFFNKSFLKFCKSHDITLYHNYSPLKAAMIERFNRSLMTRIQKILTFRKTNVYHDILNEVVNEVTKYNQMDCWFNTNRDNIDVKQPRRKFKVFW
jgi:transposase InsO family protein